MAPKNHHGSQKQQELQHSQPTASQNPKPVAYAESESADSEPKSTTSKTKLKQLSSKPIKPQPQAQAQTSLRSRKRRHVDDNNANGNTKKKETVSAAGGSNAQPQAQSSAESQTSLRSGKRRDVDANGHTSKRRKEKETVSAAAAGGSNDEEESKKSHGRVFSKKEDLVILKGIADFLSKTGKDPLKYAADFHEFLKEKKSFRSDLSNKQIKRKVRGLKDKFEKSQSFTNSHDKKAFRLFKKINWRNNDGNEAGEENGNDVDVNHVGSSKNVASNVAYILNEIFSCFDGDLTKDAAKKGLESIEESKRVEMEAEWRKLRIDEMNLAVAREQYARDKARLIL